MGEKEVLLEVAKRLENVKRRGGDPWVVLDLDSTLYEVAPRTFAIIRDWISESTGLPKHISEALAKIQMSHIGYSLKDTFSALGLDISKKDIETSWENLKNYWWDRFFANTYLLHDRAYPGAVEFVQELYRMGAGIAYLTGREEAKMKKGTLENLKRDGFPLDPKRCELFMKTDPALSDHDYKQQTAKKILQKGEVIASFENEPQNVVILYETFPDTLHVFMDTVCSDSPAKPVHGIYKIKGFNKK
jgi:hypothetical protein